MIPRPKVVRNFWATRVLAVANCIRSVADQHLCTQGLLAVPFVLHSQPTAAYDERENVVAKMAHTAHRRYAEILRDVEELINDHSQYIHSN